MDSRRKAAISAVTHALLVFSLVVMGLLLFVSGSYAGLARGGQ